MGRPDLNGALQPLYCLGRAFTAVIRQAEVVESICKARIQTHRLFEFFDCQIEFLSHLVDTTKIVVCHREVGPKRDGLLQQLQRFIVMMVRNAIDSLVVKHTSFVGSFLDLACSSIGPKQQYTNQNRSNEQEMHNS